MTPFHRSTPGDEWLAVRAGGAQHVWRIGQVQFNVRRPWETGGTFGTPDMELLAALGALLVGGQPIAERIFRSLEWYRMAKVEDDQVSVLSRAVMIAPEGGMVIGHGDPALSGGL